MGERLNRSFIHYTSYRGCGRQRRYDPQDTYNVTCCGFSLYVVGKNQIDQLQLLIRPNEYLWRWEP